MRKDALVSLRDGLWIMHTQWSWFGPSMSKQIIPLHRSVYCIILREEEKEGRKVEDEGESRGELS